MWVVALFIGIVSLLGILYPYVVYPALLNWLNRRGSLPDLGADFRTWETLPSVTIVVAAYNEEKAIVEKLENFLALDYPQDRLKLILASDGSSDRTVELAEAYAQQHPQVKVRAFTSRRGKVCVLNEVLDNLDDEYVIFSDANVRFAPNAVVELIQPFQHPNIGTVCGKLTLLDVQTGSSQAESKYWQLENWLKEKEGKVAAALGANGAIFAMRRALWTSCPEHLLVEDFYVPMKLLCEGWGNYFQSSAQAFEETPPTLGDEFHRRVRIGAGAYQILFRLLPEMGKLSPFALFAYLSHKVMRWIAPMLLVSLTCCGVYLAGYVLGWPVAVLSLAGISLLLSLGHRLPGLPKRANSLLRMIQQFLGMNFALLVGFWRFLRSSQQVTWQRTAR